MRTVLTIAGSDPTGGAGIEQDLRVFQVLGFHGLAVATALTVQDSRRVHAVHPVEEGLVRRRLDVLLDDLVPDAVKIGMLATSGLVEVVTRVVMDLAPGIPVVLDPVVTSSSGAELLDDDGVERLRTGLMRRADVLSPNRVEALRLLGLAPHDSRAAAALAGDLVAAGARCVVVTGGDSPEPLARDHVQRGDEAAVLEAARVTGPSPHGTGCAFSSATAARLARGDDVLAALRFAKEFTAAAVRRAGGGRLLVLDEKEATP